MSEDPVYYNAEEAGRIVRQSANWMKTHARAGDIPFTRIGRTVLWTPQQLAEIGRRGEQRPKPPPLAPRTPARRRAAEGTAALKAKPPRRKPAAA